jgi:hypothetical protein
MSKTYYTIGNLNDNKKRWVASKPLLKNIYYTEGTQLCYVSDLFWNQEAIPGDLINFSLYKVQADSIYEFLIKREALFKDNFSYEKLSEIGFEELVEFNYITDINNIDQKFGKYSLSISYSKQGTDKYLMACPTIEFT